MWFWRRLRKAGKSNASVLNELGVKRELLGKIVTLKMGSTLAISWEGSESPLTFQIIEGKIDGKEKGRKTKETMIW